MIWLFLNRHHHLIFQNPIHHRSSTRHSTVQWQTWMRPTIAVARLRQLFRRRTRRRHLRPHHRHHQRTIQISLMPPTTRTTNDDDTNLSRVVTMKIKKIITPTLQVPYQLRLNNNNNKTKVNSLNHKVFHKIVINDEVINNNNNNSKSTQPAHEQIRAHQHWAMRRPHQRPRQLLRHLLRWITTISQIIKYLRLTLITI